MMDRTVARAAAVLACVAASATAFTFPTAALTPVPSSPASRTPLRIAPRAFAAADIASGASPRPASSSLSEAAAWHKERRREILKRYPEVRELCGPDPRTVPAMVAANVAQILLTVTVVGSLPWLALVALALTVGATLSMVQVSLPGLRDVNHRPSGLTPTYQLHSTTNHDSTTGLHSLHLLPPHQRTDVPTVHGVA